MAPRKKYKCSVIVFDVASKKSFKQEAIKCYVNICADKYFSNSLDCSQLVLTNTAHTSNKLNEVKENKYHNIVEATEMVHCNPSNAKYIEEATAASGNWLEGVHVAVEALMSSSDGNSFDMYQLIVLSDLSQPMNISDADIKKEVKIITKLLTQINGYIYFLGPDIPISNMLSSKKEIYDWVQSIEVDENNTNYNIALQFLEESMGVMCDLTVGLELVLSYVPSKKGYPFIEPLKFQDLEIQTACMKFLDCKSVLKPKRDKEGMTETVYVYATDQSEEVHPDEVMKGLALHNKLVIIPPDVAKGVKEYNRFFKLLGFTDASNVPQDYMLASSTNIVLVNETKDTEIGALNYIVKACHKFNKYGIALRAYMKNCRPRLYCLIPKLEPTCFIAVELPYAQDVNILYQSKDCSTVKFKDDAYPDYDNVPALKEDTYAYLDSIDMKGKVKVHPSMRGNVNRRRIIDNLIHKLKGEEMVKTDLPLGDLRITPTDDAYTAINANWFAKNEMESDDMK